MRRIEPESLKRWRWGVAAALALAFISLMPQLHLWAARGREWHGSDFSFFSDEAAYEAYANALVDGRPRLNDPYTGRDDSPAAPQPESLFSIQFVPAYAIALPARLFNLSAATVFIVLWPLAAFATTLALTRLINAVTGDERTAATIALVVICLCTFIQKSVRTLRGLETTYLPLPFLRRYLPALPFALFFIFCLFVWRALTHDDDNDERKRVSRTKNALCAGLAFVPLVYSYFYLWTAAAAWLACFALLFVAAARPTERRRAASVLLVIASVAAVALAPYAWLLARRAQTMNSAQALVHTRAPDLFRTSELLGALALVLLVCGAWRGWLASWRDRPALLAASFALMPFAVFNQQVITGRSLQPIHYEQFIANYVSLLSLTLACVIVWRGRDALRAGGGNAAATIPRRVLAAVACVALGWASVEVIIATRRASHFNLWGDEMRPVYLRLAEIARREDDTSPTAATAKRLIVFCPDIAQADRLPTVAPQAVLWAPHMFVFSGVTRAEEKERLYQQLYYSNVDEGRFASFIGRPHPYRTAVFGWSRVVNGLDAARTPVTPEELHAETRAYSAYLASFTRERAAHTPLAYVVAAAGQTDLGNVGRWYEHDAGERVGNYAIYRVKLR